MTVEIYTRTTCAPCKMMKAYMTNKNIDYVERDVDADPSLIDKVIQLSGRMMVPVTVVGEKVISGFNIGALVSALEGTSVDAPIDPSDALACEGCQ